MITEDDLPVGLEEEDPTEPPIDLDKPPDIDTKQKVLDEWALVYPHTRRGPRDVVISGPVADGWGPGQYFRSKSIALQHYVAKYGGARVRKTEGNTRGRWSFLIKDLKHDAA